jgi:predicted phage-related endonuclease
MTALLSAAPSAPTRAHRSYLGASDLPALLGLDPHRTALAVYCEKTGRAESITTPEMEAGNDHEHGVIAGYTRRVVEREKRVERVRYPGPGTLISPRDPRRGATPDAIATHVRYREISVQAKFVGVRGAGDWGPEENGPDAVPERVIVQVHWETLHAREVLGFAAEVAHVCADIGTDRRFYEVPIDDALIADLLDVHNEWWRRHVEGDEMPMVTEDDRDLVSRIFREVRAPLDENPSSEALELVRRYDAARAIAKEAEAAKVRAATELCAAIGEREGFAGRWGRATWRTVGASRRLDVRLRGG